MRASLLQRSQSSFGFARAGNADWVPADWLFATARAIQLRNHDQINVFI